MPGKHDATQRGGTHQPRPGVVGRRANERPGDDRVYGDEETEFILHVERRQREEGKKFPAWSDVLRWAKELGYRKI